MMAISTARSIRSITTSVASIPSAHTCRAIRRSSLTPSRASGGKLDALSEELAGRTLGDFVVRHRIGEGGYGAVYRAEQALLGREAVVKVLHGRHRSTKTVIQ